MDIASFLAGGLNSLDETATQRSLLQYFELLKSSPAGCLMCCQYLSSAEPRDARGTFLSLQVLEHHLKNGADAGEKDSTGMRMKIKESTLQWYKQCSLSDEKPFIKNKTCQILVSFFKEEYPQKWPSFFTDIMLYLNGEPQSADLFLRTMVAIDSEVADRHIIRSKQEEERNVFIKDSMREQCVAMLVEAWYQILQLHTIGRPDIVCLCLDVIGAYISWIDINYIVNDKFINTLLSFLNVDVLRESTCDCFLEIVNKGMEPGGKLKLVELLSSVVEKFGLLQVLQCDDLDFVAKVAALINGMGVQLISSWNKLSKLDGNKDLASQIRTAVDHNLPYLFRFLAHEDDDISQAVFEFTHAYLNLLKEVNGKTEKDHKSIQELLFVVINKMKFDADYNFDEEGEEEAMFSDFRKQMKVLFDNIAKLDKQLTISAVHLIVTKAMSEWQEIPMQEVELAIHCLYLLGETIPGQHLFSNERSFSALQDMMSKLITSNVSFHQHSAVALQFFETVTRYERFFFVQTQQIGPVLAAFLDNRGLRNNVPVVCSRTSYLLMRFVKALKNQMQPFVTGILEQLRSLLVVFPLVSPPESKISENDRFYLYEVAATLIMCTNSPEQSQFQRMTDLLSPVILTFSSTVDKLKQGKLSELESLECAQELQHLVAYTSRASKAFNGQLALKNSGCQPCFTEALTIFLHSLTIPIHRDVIHAGVRQYLHRMIICLGDDLLPFIPVALSHLLQDCEVRDIQEFMPLINQVIARFKTQISPFLCEVFMPVVNGIFTILSSPVDPSDTQASRDRQLLRRSYFLFIGTLLNNGVFDVLKSQDRDSIKEVLRTLVNGAVDLPDPQSQKICFSIFNCLIATCGTNNELENMRHFVYSSIFPACFEAPLRPTFDFEDAQTMLVLQEIASTLMAVLKKQSPSEVIDQIKSQYFSQVQCPPYVVQGYCEALATAKDPKELKSFLKAFYAQLRNQ